MQTQIIADVLITSHGSALHLGADDYILLQPATERGRGILTGLPFGKLTNEGMRVLTSDEDACAAFDALDEADLITLMV